MCVHVKDRLTKCPRHHMTYSCREWNRWRKCPKFKSNSLIRQYSSHAVMKLVKSFAYTISYRRVFYCPNTNHRGERVTLLSCSIYLHCVRLLQTNSRCGVAIPLNPPCHSRLARAKRFPSSTPEVPCAHM